MIPIPLLSFAAAQQSRTPRDLLLHFYKDPRRDRLIGFFDTYEKPHSQLNWEAYPPTVGFFAVIFRKHPDQIERLIPAKMSPRAADALAAALLLSAINRRPRTLKRDLTKRDLIDPEGSTWKAPGAPDKSKRP